MIFKETCTSRFFNSNYVLHSKLGLQDAVEKEAALVEVRHPFEMNGLNQFSKTNQYMLEKAIYALLLFSVARDQKICHFKSINDTDAKSIKEKALVTIESYLH